MSAPPPEVVAVLARQLLLEDQARRALRGLADAGVPAVLVKGPVTARLLYDQPHEHPYADIDLLVSPAAYATAREHFLSQGFRDLADGVEQAYRADNEAHLVQGDVCVDLHSRLVGVPAGRAQAAWHVLTADLDSLDLHGQAVPVLSPPGRALHLALHVAQSAEADKSLRDLSVGLRRFPRAVWEQAAVLAVEVGAAPAFALGLRRLPEGRALADALALSTRTSAEAWLRLRGAPEEALALERLRALPDHGARRRHLRALLDVADPAAGRTGWQRRGVVAARLALAVPLWLRALLEERRP